jgi:hypothetical protein
MRARLPYQYCVCLNILVFKFNFFDHTKLIISHGGLHILYIDKHGDRHLVTMASIVEDAINVSSLGDDARKFNAKIVRKITFCKDLLHHILTYSGSRVEEGGVGLDA